MGAGVYVALSLLSWDDECTQRDIGRVPFQPFRELGLQLIRPGKAT